MFASALLIFLVSGFAALLYQVIWQRLLAIFSGADVYSTTIVVAAFMAGLGCGSLAGGWISDRISRTRCLALFIAAETGIAAFGLLSKPFLYDLLYQRFGHLAVSPALTGVVLFISLLAPTMLMGVSLPLLARALTSNVAHAASTIGSLYAANTLGAAVGAFAATWVLLPSMGLEGSLHVAALLNLTCALGAWPLARGVAAPAPKAEPSHAGASRLATSAGHLAGERSSFVMWVSLFALSGFIALSFEIVWFRLLGVMLKSTSVTFGHLLAQYLLWLGIGSAVGSALAHRIRRPAVAVLIAQAGAIVYAGLSLALFVAVVGDWGRLSGIFSYFGTYEPMDWRTDLRTRQFWWLYGALPIFLFAPSTFLMGFAFPMLQKVVQMDLAHLGRRVGILLMANIVGSTVGAIGTGWIFLAWLGTAGTLRLLVALSLVFAVPAVRRLGSYRQAGYAAAVGAVAGAVLLLPSAHALWARLHGSDPEHTLIAEDGSGVSLLKTAAGREVGVFVNGLGQSSLPYGGIHTALGALPAFLHAAPRDALLIGLGSGDTLFALAGRRELQRIVSVEIVKPQIDTLVQLASRWPYAGLLGALHDPRIAHVFADGRLYVRRAQRRYDIIEADALRPGSAYAGNLYSTAYFELLRRHLNPSGLAVTWSPTPRVVRTFASVFPHVLAAGDILLGSNEPIVFRRAEILRRLEDPTVLDYYAAAQIDIQRILRPLILTAGGIERARNEGLAADVNTDLFPRDEFGLHH